VPLNAEFGYRGSMLNVNVWHVKFFGAISIAYLWAIERPQLGTAPMFVATIVYSVAVLLTLVYGLRG